MNIWKLFLTVIISLWGFTALTGCGLGDKACTRFGMNKFTGELEVYDSMGCSIDVDEIGLTKSTTTQPSSAYAKGVHVKRDAALANESIAKLVDANTRMYAQWGTNTNGAMDAAGRNFVQPLVQVGIRYLDNQALGNTNATQVALNRNDIVAGIVQGVTGGQIPMGRVTAQASPEIRSDVQRQLADIRKQLDAAKVVSPPASTPHEDPQPDKPQAQAPLYRSTDRVELARMNL